MSPVAAETISLTPVTEILTCLGECRPLVERIICSRVSAYTFVEEANLSQNIFLLRRALGDERAEPKYIETIVRRGYRFIAAVRAVDGGDETADSSQESVSVGQRLVIAVLPFLNATGDPEIEYLADGLTDNIINNMSRVSKLRVMSRSAVLRFRAKEIDPKQVGRDLGVNAVVIWENQLSIRRHRDWPELVDTSTGWQLWVRAST